MDLSRLKGNDNFILYRYDEYNRGLLELLIPVTKLDLREINGGVILCGPLI